MSEGTKNLRLSKVAKEFNLSLGKIVEFLSAKGHKVDSNPNTKIGDEEYTLLLKEFSSDKSAREEAETVAQQSHKLKRETIVLDELKVRKGKEEEEVVIKDLTVPKTTPEEKVVVVEEKAEIKVDAESLEGPKVLGKVDLDTLNLKTKPARKSKKLKEEETETRETLPVEKASVETPAKEPENNEPIAPLKEEVKEEFLETKYEKLEGPKILGRVELPVAKEVPKKASEGDADKRKRKRIRKGGLSQEEIKKVGKEQSAIARERAKEKYGDPRARKPVTGAPAKARHELTEEEIQAQIKETLARLSEKGNKSKTSKYRREKRDEIRDREYPEM